MKLEEITASSEKGYIDSDTEIGRAVKRLADFNVSDLSGINANAVKAYIREVMEDLGMNPEYADNVTCAEALSMFDSIVTSDIYESNGEDWCEDKRLLMLGALNNALISSCDSLAVRSFMALTVKGYMQYLAEKAGAKGNWIIINYEVLCAGVRCGINFEITDTTTIKELLLKLDMFTRKPWLPSEDIAEYEKSIRKGYDCLYRLFIVHLSEAFPEYFNITGLKEKYSKGG